MLLFLVIQNFSIAQSITEKIDFTYDNFNIGNYYDASKYLGDLEEYFVDQEFDYSDVISFYDLSISCYINLEKNEKAIEFCKKKKKYIEYTVIPEKDSIILANEIFLYHLDLDSSDNNKYIENILKLSKGKAGHYFDVYNYYYFIKLEMVKGGQNYATRIQALKDLELYNMEYQGSESIEMARIYLNLGILYMEISEFDLSESYLNNAIKNLQLHNEEYSIDGIHAIICLGSLHRRLGNDELALDYYNKAENFGESVFVIQPQLLSNLLQNKANLLNNFEDFEKFREIETLYMKTIQLRRYYLGENDSEYAKALVNLGSYYISTGDFENARTYITKGDSIVRSRNDVDAVDLAFIYNALGELNFELDYSEKGFEYVNRALDILTRNGLENGREFAMATSNLALRYWSMRDYKSAILHFEKAINLYTEVYGKNHDIVATERQALAALYNEIGNKTKANEILNQILNNNNLSENFNIQHQIDASLASMDYGLIKGFDDATYQKQLDLLEKIESSELAFSDRHIEVLKRLAEMEVYRDDLNLCLVRLREIMRMSIDAFGYNHSKVADSFSFLSELFVLRGELDSADSYLSMALDIQVKVFGDDNPKITSLLRDRAYLEIKKGNLEMSDFYFEKSIRIEESNFLKTYLVLNEIGMLEYKKNIDDEVRRYIDARILGFEKVQSKSFVNLCESWHNSSGINYSLNLRVKRAVLEKNDELITSDYNLLKNQMAKRNRWVGLTAKSRINLNVDVDSLDNLILNLERKLYQSLNLELSEMKQVDDSIINLSVSPKSIFIHLAEIDPNEGDFLCEIYQSNSTHPIIFRVKFDMEYIHSIGQKSQRENALLYELLFKPFETYTDSVDTIFIAADGVFEIFNVAVFFNQARNKYLFEYAEVVKYDNIRSFSFRVNNFIFRRYVNSASLYGFPDYNSVKAVSVAGNNKFKLTNDFNVVYLDSVKRYSLKALSLPFTKVEVESIYGLLKRNNWKVDLNIGEEALEGKIKMEKSPRVLHVATHGYFFENVPIDTIYKTYFGVADRRKALDPMLRSGLLFAGANLTLGGCESSIENGLLSASEATFLDLRNTELVVLSACETGRGQTINSEGVYGIRKAFSDAGAANVIMTLWKIDDMVTQDFMSNFYGNWVDFGLTIREAFTKTRLYMKSIYPEPYYWGAFVLVGE